MNVLMLSGDYLQKQPPGKQCLKQPVKESFGCGKIQRLLIDAGMFLPDQESYCEKLGLGNGCT
jgi:hypothetical protein